MSPKRILGLAIAASTALASSAALAATTPERVRGTIEKSNQCRYTPRVYKRGAPSVGPAISPGWPEWFSQ
jgi:hypothetical protein